MAVDFLWGQERDRLSFAAIALAAAASAFGWLAVDRWVPVNSDGTPILVAVLRTVFALIPAIAGFLIATRRQRRVHKLVSARLDDLRRSFDEFQRLKAIEHEINTMNRLSKVAREAAKNTASTTKELLGAIRTVGDQNTQERLLERCRNQVNSVVTVFAAVGEQMEESGIAIHKELTADDSMHILDRERKSTALGLEYARELMQQRGIEEGRDQLKIAAEQATLLQNEVASLKAISHATEVNHE